MKFWVPGTSLAVSVAGKPYKVEKDKEGKRCVELPTKVPKETVVHLLTLGWLLADTEAANFVREELGAKLDSEGQVELHESAKKELAPKKK